MEMFKRARLAVVVALLVYQAFAPTTAHPLERPPGAPSIIVLEGRTEPPISIAIVRAEAKPLRDTRVIAIVPFLGLRLVIVPSFAQISRIWR